MTDTDARWKLVPVEPTEAMLDAYWHQCGESKAMRGRTHINGRLYYAAMLAAAPPQGEPGDDLVGHPCGGLSGGGGKSHRSYVYADGRQHYCERCGEKIDHADFSNIPADYVVTHDAGNYNITADRIAALTAEVEEAHAKIEKKNNTIIRLHCREGDLEAAVKAAEAANAKLREVLEPFIQTNAQDTGEMVKTINRKWAGFQPITVTVTKDQFLAGRAALRPLAATGGGTNG